MGFGAVLNELLQISGILRKFSDFFLKFSSKVRKIPEKKRKKKHWMLGSPNNIFPRMLIQTMDFEKQVFFVRALNFAATKC